MKLVVAAVRPTPILWWRASGLESPTEVPASTLPARGTKPVRANIASRRVVLPLWKGPTSAMHRGPRGLLTSCPISPPPHLELGPGLGRRPDAPPTSTIWQAGKTSLQCSPLSLSPSFTGRGRNSREAGISGEGRGTMPAILSEFGDRALHPDPLPARAGRGGRS